MKKLFTTIMISIALIACGSDDDSGGGSSTSSNTLKGTVAIGKPIAATITIKAADGTTITTTSDSSGNYSADIANNIGPFFIKIEPTDNTLDTLYSFSTGSGVANGTQFTTLAIFIAKDTDLSTAFNNWSSLSDSWKLADIEAALARISHRTIEKGRQLCHNYCANKNLWKTSGRPYENTV